eukprot:756329_1
MISLGQSIDINFSFPSLTSFNRITNWDLKTMANKIELASESKCCGLCASKQIIIEGLFITTTEKNCCETTQNVIPMASVDDVTLVTPTKCAICCKLFSCGTTTRNGRLVLCDFNCTAATLYVSYASTKLIAVEKIEDPEQIFEQLKQRLHVAKGGPVRNAM